MKKETINEKALRIAQALGLEGIARNSFVKLCLEGCEPEFLAEHLYLITAEPEAKIRPKGTSRKSYTVNLRALDSFTGALGGYEKRDLKALQKQLLKYARNIEKLNQSSLVKHIKDEEYDTDIFKIPRLLVYYANGFIPFLVKRYELIGKRQKPLYTEFLVRVMDHIKKSTGKTHDSLFADVLSGLGKSKSEGALKQKRYRGKPKGGKK